MFVRRRSLVSCAVLAAGLGLASRVPAVPALTAIQDVLYKADGTRFNGSATITWSSFEAADTSNITKHSVTVKIVDGQFRVQLVPNADLTPASYYGVRFTSDGRIQFEETWQVPVATQALRMRDVRVAPPAPVEQGTAGPIQIEDVVGLTADLSARPLRGPGFMPGRTAVIANSGALEAAAGSASDCVRVDGTSGPCGTGGGLNVTFTEQENPAGAVDGSNSAFTVAAAPAPATSLALHRNGMLMKPGQDYTISQRAITFLANAIPQPGDTLLASYRVESTGAPAGWPEVLCSGEGADTSAATAAVVGTCAIGGRLNMGDRVELQFDFVHQGSTAGFTFEVRWGSVSLVSRSAGAGETLVTGRGEAAIGADATQLSVQSWGSTLPLGVGVASSAETAEFVEFLGSLETAGEDTVKLRHYTLIRYPPI
jgi:hypothetical protein